MKGIKPAKYIDYFKSVPRSQERYAPSKVKFKKWLEKYYSTVFEDVLLHGYTFKLPYGAGEMFIGRQPKYLKGKGRIWVHRLFFLSFLYPEIPLAVTLDEKRKKQIDEAVKNGKIFRNVKTTEWPLKTKSVFNE